MDGTLLSKILHDSRNLVWVRSVLPLNCGTTFASKR